MSTYPETSTAVMHAIINIISHLGELCHHSAILSYLDNMETTGYQDGKDTPKELRYHFSELIANVNNIRREVYEIDSFLEPYYQDLPTKSVVEATFYFHRLEAWTKSHKEWAENVIADNLLMRNVDNLRYKTGEFLSEVGKVMEKIVPISFQKIDSDKLNFDDIKRNPQATVQHAFTLLETQIRKKINANSDIFGEPLINAAFGSNGCLTFGETPAEQLGVRNFISGAYATFRNPRMHREVDDNEREALQLLTVIDCIMVIVDKAKLK
jgi:hypothetical protein